MVEVLRLFRDNNIGFVVVSRSPGECLGTLSERDCCNAVAEHGTEAPIDAGRRHHEPQCGDLFDTRMGCPW